MHVLRARAELKHDEAPVVVGRQFVPDVDGQAEAGVEAVEVGPRRRERSLEGADCVDLEERGDLVVRKPLARLANRSGTADRSRNTTACSLASGTSGSGRIIADADPVRRRI
ncbi:hypothetical protein OV079_12410 [Nannocystis pusilla]|uniref:Uncharacterized protein n=1 Tax=Nannocystis pusilla TaxID=889268 RepID=A0A9X3ELP1_9BACT|nr:hypothetical protein [Nannocystis pusilla]MCY1006349.1 hypothetical protein [Nannocystis pusilla]